MPELGRGLLVLAVLLSLYGLGAAVIGARRERPELVASARRASYALALVATGAFLLLELAFLRTDLSFSVVQSHSSTTTPLFYRATAAWSSQEGSMLLWLFFLSLWTALVLWRTQYRMRDVQPWATAVLLGFAAFFSILLVVKVSPFAVLPVAASEGAGLNPLLRYPSMMSHPPMLYAGYTLWAVPFAFAVGALIAGRVDAEWLKATRSFAIGAWLCLGIGIILGARWSYAELGWGGYWGWDPVENASLLPWLTGTAFIHSAMVQERRGMLKFWNASLILMTGTLAIFGTFLVRSGVVQSIHAFTGSDLGWPFVLLIIVMTVASVTLVLWRREALRTEHRLDSLLSREAMFLANNLVLVAMTFVVFWGTMFPLISELMTGTEQTLGPPWYGRYITPLALVLVALTAVGPVVPWRRARWAAVRRHLLLPLIVAAIAVVVAVLIAGDSWRPRALAAFGLGAAALTVALAEFWRGASARSAMTGHSRGRALAAVISGNRRRYGGYLVHIGMIVLLLGVAASSAFQRMTDVRLKPGETVPIGSGYALRYDRPDSGVRTAGSDIERIELRAQITILKNGRPFATMSPSRDYYPITAAPTVGAMSRYFDGESTSEVAIRSSAVRDVWVAVTPDTTEMLKVVREGDKRFAAVLGTIPDEQYGTLLGRGIGGLVERYAQQAPPASFRAIVSPLVFWVWVGSGIVFVGGVVCLWPARQRAAGRVRARYVARVAREVGRAEPSPS